MFAGFGILKNRTRSKAARRGSIQVLDNLYDCRSIEAFQSSITVHQGALDQFHTGRWFSPS